MKLTEAASKLNPGTAWNLSVDEKGNQVLTQSIDASARVPVPSIASLQSYISSNPSIVLPDIQTQILITLQGGPPAIALQNNIIAFQAANAVSVTPP